MNQELITETTETDLSTLKPYDAKIDEIQEAASKLSVKDINDTQGIAAVHDMRISVKTLRIEVDKEGKRLRADAVRRQKEVLAETKRIIGRIQPIEDELKEQEAIVEREKERKRKEEEAKQQALIESRLKAFQAVGVVKPESQVADMPDELFEHELAQATKIHAEKLEAERIETERIEAEREQMEKQRQEQEAIRKEQEKQAAELKAAQDKVIAEREAIEREKAAEQKRIADADAEKKQLADLEIAKKEAAELAAKQERERIEAEKLEAERKAELVEQERLEELAARPYKKKLVALADQIDDLENPEGKHQAEVNDVLHVAATKIRAIAKKR